jgi:hypothetical protein
MDSIIAQRADEISYRPAITALPATRARHLSQSDFSDKP